MKNKRLKNHKITEMQAEGGITIQIRLTEMDLACLEHLKFFYREVFGVNPSTDLIIRKIINAHMCGIDEVITNLNNGIPINKIEGLEYEICTLCLASFEHDGAEYLPPLRLDPQGKLPTFFERTEYLREHTSKGDMDKENDISILSHLISCPIGNRRPSMVQITEGRKDK